MILDGKAVSAKIIEDLKTELARKGTTPHLSVILVGDDPASRVYVRNKKKKAEYIGIKADIFEYPANVEEKRLFAEFLLKRMWIALHRKMPGD